MKKRTNSGFTMMETLVAVAILIILLGLGFVGVQQHRRSMKQLELDEISREIFIAAQNHLTVAKTQGVLQQRDTSNKDIVGNYHDPYHCFFVDNTVSKDSKLSTQGNILYDMLPRFSLDDTVRLSGSYAIQYDLASGTVINVFYSDASDLSNVVFTDSEYGTLFNDETTGYIGADNSGNRLNYNGSGQIIGWYGGDDIEGLSKVELYAPKVKLINEERLLVEVIFPAAQLNKMTSDNSINAELKVKIKEWEPKTEGKSESTKPELLVAKDRLTDFIVTATLDTKSNPATLSKTYVLDDVTENGKHFCDMFYKENDSNAIQPGKDITVWATVSSNTRPGPIPKSNEVDGNSLFAKLQSGSDDDTGGMTAEIRNIRHLENLDPSISGLDPASLSINSAKQTEHISWNGFKEAINKSKPSDVQIFKNNKNNGTFTEKGTYAPVNPVVSNESYLNSYDGGLRKISDIIVRGTGESGVFGKIKAKTEGGTTIKNLVIVDPTIVCNDSKSAGALAGELDGVNIESILAHHNIDETRDKTEMKVESKGNAGGLIGKITNGSVKKCASALYVNSTAGNAGGLIGEVTASSGKTATVQDSYSGGHTSSGQYVFDTSKPTDTSVAGHMNVIGSSSAGGLIGSVQSARIENTYSTCSVYSSGLAGGLIGNSSDGLTVAKNSYCTGRVEASKSENRQAFVGGENLSEGSEKNYYLTTVNNGEIANKQNSATSADETTSSYNSIASGLSTAHPYDEYLVKNYKNMYFYKTISSLQTGKSGPKWISEHYGDWPSVETWVVNTKQ